MGFVQGSNRCFVFLVKGNMHHLCMLIFKYLVFYPISAATFKNAKFVFIIKRQQIFYPDFLSFGTILAILWNALLLLVWRSFNPACHSLRLIMIILRAALWYLPCGSLISSVRLFQNLEHIKGIDTGRFWARYMSNKSESYF